MPGAEPTSEVGELALTLNEMLVQVVYLCQVVLTNPSSSRQKLDLLLQIPRGAIQTTGLPQFFTNSTSGNHFFTT